MLENHPDWKPSLLLGHSNGRLTDKAEAACQRGLKRKMIAEPPDEQQQPEPLVAKQSKQRATEDFVAELDVVIGEECQSCVARHGRISSLLEENRRLEEEIERCRTEANCQGAADDQVKYLLLTN